MSKPARRCGAQVSVLRLFPVILVCFAVPLAGCSSAVSRFDYPVFGYSATDDSPTGAISPKQPVYGSSSRRDSYRLSQADNIGSNQSYSAPVAEVSRSEPLPRLQQTETERYRPTQQVVVAQSQRAGPGGSVTVRSGETLYSLARRNDVSVDALKRANNIRGNDIRVGQRLVMPGYSGSAASKTSASSRPVSSIAASGKTHRVQPGDTVYSISRRYGVPYNDLAQVNNLSNPNAIKLGQELKLPRGSGKAVAPVKPKRVAAVSVKRNTAAAKPRVKPKKPAKKPEALPSPEPRSQGRFRWPVRGRIISKFGPKADGSHNDGINVAIPAGTSVKAVENGVVAYAGNELKGYGNLVLVRHADNWVSAYAHNGRLLVKRGDKITRGQVIAKSGRSGSVSQPQLHFELRRGSKPVNPMKYMAAL